MTTLYFSCELALRLGNTLGVSTLPKEKHSCLHTLQVAWLFLYPNHTSPLLASARAFPMPYIAHSLMQQTAQQLYWETACFAFLIWKTKACCKLCWLGSHTSLTQRKKEKKRRKYPLVTADAFLFPLKVPCQHGHPQATFQHQLKINEIFIVFVFQTKTIFGNLLPVRRGLQVTRRDSFSSGISYETDVDYRIVAAKARVSHRAHMEGKLTTGVSRCSLVQNSMVQPEVSLHLPSHSESHLLLPGKSLPQQGPFQLHSKKSPQPSLTDRELRTGLKMASYGLSEVYRIWETWRALINWLFQLGVLTQSSKNTASVLR